MTPLALVGMLIAGATLVLSIGVAICDGLERRAERGRLQNNPKYIFVRGVAVKQ